MEKTDECREGQLQVLQHLKTMQQPETCVGKSVVKEENIQKGREIKTRLILREK